MRGIPIALALTLVLGACSEPDTSDIFSVQGVVVGHVLNGFQAPIPGATVTGTAQYPVVGGSFPLVDSRMTDSAGAFRLVLTTVNMPDTVAPLAVHVAAMGYAAFDTTGLQVRIRRTIVRDDTSRVVITLAP